MNPPDLDNPTWQLLAFALVMWGVVWVLWMHDRPSPRRGRTRRRLRSLADRLRAAARDRRGLRRLPLEAGSRAGAGPEPGRRGHAASVRAEQEHDDARGVRPLPRLDLTDAELTALARALAGPHLGVLDADAYLSALAKIDRAALDVVHADRVRRRA